MPCDLSLIKRVSKFGFQSHLSSNLAKMLISKLGSLKYLDQAEGDFMISPQSTDDAL